MPQLPAAKVDLFLHRQDIDTTTPGGKALFQMMGVFPEFERAMITARIRAGVDRAKATGVTKNGKPTGRPDAATEQAIRDQLAQGGRDRIGQAAGNSRRECSRYGREDRAHFSTTIYRASCATGPETVRKLGYPGFRDLVESRIASSLLRYLVTQ